MTAPVDWKSLRFLPTPGGALTAVKEACYLLPGFKSLLWGIPLKHPDLPLCPIKHASGFVTSRVPMKRLLDDFPPIWSFEKRKKIGHANTRAS